MSRKLGTTEKAGALRKERDKYKQLAAGALAAQAGERALAAAREAARAVLRNLPPDELEALETLTGRKLADHLNADGLRIGNGNESLLIKGEQ